MYLIHKEESKVSGNLRISIIRHEKHSLNLYTTETRFYDFKVNLDISEISIDKIVVSNIILKSKNKFNCFFLWQSFIFLPISVIYRCLSSLDQDIVLKSLLGTNTMLQ